MQTYNGFFDSNQLNNYLSNSVIRLGTLPIYVLRAQFTKGNLISLYYTFLKGRSFLSEISNIFRLDELNLTPVPLGFLYQKAPSESKKTIAYYTSVVNRFPMRTWKIGLSSDNMSIIPLNSSIFTDSTDVLLSKELHSTIVGDYYTFETVINLILESNIKGIIPFHRYFAIKKTYNTKTDFELELIYYRYPKQPIGNVVEKKCQLFKNFNYLNEHLEEVLNGQSR